MSATSAKQAPADRKLEEQTHVRKLQNGPQVRPRSIDTPAATTDDAFTKFYSTLTSGPLSKLSSMLAFAGLPLADDSQEDSLTQSQTEKTSARATSGPDVNNIFSKAALRAIEDQQRTQGFTGNTFGPGESFYLIPTSGGTTSYANILTRAQQDAQRGKDSTGADSDEFVDANETLPRVRGAAIDSNVSASVREEELQIENKALKQILDKLAHRLQAFESHAQDASMAALTHSMASLRSQPQHHGKAQGGTSGEMEDRMRAMEAQLEREMKERQRLDIDNQKQRAVITKYRSHWDQLKDSARAKERAKKERSDAGSAA